MRIGFLALIILMYTGLSAQTLTHHEVRTMYFEGWNGQCGAEELAKALSEQDIENDPVLLVYKGAALTTLANCRKMPLSKLSVFNDGKELIENAVSMAPANIEIRFIRYTVQTNIPSFLLYSNQEEDIKLMMETLTLQDSSWHDPDIKKRMIKYLLDSGDLKEDDQKKLENLIAGG